MALQGIEALLLEAGGQAGAVWKSADLRNVLQLMRAAQSDFHRRNASVNEKSRGGSRS